jgi:hypothetical protein
MLDDLFWKITGLLNGRWKLWEEARAVRLIDEVAA